MYGFMAVAYFLVFRDGFGVTLATDTVEFWFMMQIAMLCGFATAYPVNWWLIRKRLKACVRVASGSALARSVHRKRVRRLYVALLSSSD